MPRPITTVEVAFNAGWTGTPTWTDVTSYVQHVNGVDIDKWRAEEFSECGPSRCSFTLNDSDGRFTPGKVSGAHYPNVKKGRRIRVRSTTGGTTTTRFLGYIDDWSVTWPAGVTTVAMCTVTASSRMARLGTMGELRSIVEEEYLRDSPAAYYTLGEPAGSTQANDSSGNTVAPLVMAGSGTAVVFGTATGPGTDGLTAATFAGGKFLSVGTSFDAVECFFVRNGVPSGDSEVVMAVSNGVTRIAVTLSFSGGNLSLQKTDGSASGAAGNVCDGAVHHIMWEPSTGKVWRDGVLVKSDAAYAVTGAILLYVGGWFDNVTSATAILTGSIAHVATHAAVPADARIQAHSDSGLTGFVGSASGSRLIRYAAYAGIPDTECDFEIGRVPDLAHIDTTGKTALQVMREVEVTEPGILFDAGDGTLRFHERLHRYNRTMEFTLDLSSGAVTAPLAPVLDDQQMVNDMTATGSTGITARVVDTVSAEVDHGYYRQSLDVATSNADEPLMAAGWRVNRYAQPLVRIPAVEILLNQANPTITAAVLAAEVGTKFTLTGLPSNAPAASMVLFVEGMSEHIDNVEHRVTLRTSDAALFDVWTLDSATYSQLGTTTRLAY